MLNLSGLNGWGLKSPFDFWLVLASFALLLFIIKSKAVKSSGRNKLFEVLFIVIWISNIYFLYLITQSYCKAAISILFDYNTEALVMPIAYFGAVILFFSGILTLFLSHFCYISKQVRVIPFLSVLLLFTPETLFNPGFALNLYISITGTILIFISIALLIKKTGCRFSMTKSKT